MRQPPSSSPDGSGVGVGVGEAWCRSETWDRPRRRARRARRSDRGRWVGQLGVSSAPEGAQVDAAAVGRRLVPDGIGGIAPVSRRLGRRQAQVAHREIAERDGGREITGAGAGPGVVGLVAVEVVVGAGQRARGVACRRRCRCPSAGCSASASSRRRVRRSPLPTSVAFTTSAAPLARTAMPSTRQSRTTRWPSRTPVAPPATWTQVSAP